MSNRNYVQALHKTDKSRLSDYVTVGDIVDGYAIKEIWSTSFGTAMYHINGMDYTFDDVREMLAKAEEKKELEELVQDPEYWEGVRADEAYDDWRQQQIDRGEAV